MTTAAVTTQSPPPLMDAEQTEDNHLDDHDHDHDHDDDDDEQENEVEVKEWDQGGKSDCGYSEGVHDTIMSIGSSVHGFVGEPAEAIQGAMNQIGNWFQEAAYAARDLQEGKMNVGEETVQAVRSFVSGDEDDNDNDENADNAHNTDEKLDPINEASESRD